MKKNIFTIIIFMFLILNNNAISQSVDKALLKKEKSIQNLFEKIKQTKNDEKIINYNKEVLILLEKVLKKKNSFDYDFRNLINISKLKSSDNKFKIFTWNIPFSDGTYKYFGFCQYKKNKKTVLYKLNDNSNKIDKPEKSILENNNWYGALYYKILTKIYKDKTYYTLLAWDGNNDFTNKKIIDVALVGKEKIIFGQPIFKFENRIINRIVFEYANQVKMMLKYNEKLKYIVFDHLSPSQKKFKGQYIYYGPDMTHDGLEFIEGYWGLKSNIVLRNKKVEKKERNTKKSF